MPSDQWQFYVVTAIALAAVYVLLRPFLPGKRAGASGCGGCGSGTSSGKRRRAVPLTIDGRRR